MASPDAEAFVALLKGAGSSAVSPSTAANHGLGPGNAIGVSFGEAPSDPTKKPDPFTEVGSSGLAQYGGFVREEFLPQLQGDRGLKVYREMYDNDPIIGSLVFAIQMLIRQVQWRVEPPEASTVEEIVDEREAERAKAVSMQQQAQQQQLMQAQAGMADNSSKTSLTAQGGGTGAPPKPGPRPAMASGPAPSPFHKPIAPAPGTSTPLTQPGTNNPVTPNTPNSNPRGGPAQSSASQGQPGLPVPGNPRKPQRGGSQDQAIQNSLGGRVRKWLRGDTVEKAGGSGGGMVGGINALAPDDIDPESGQPMEFPLGEGPGSPVTPQQRKAEELAVFVETCIHDTDTPWSDLLSQVLTMIVYGFAYHEIVYKKRNGPNPDFPSQGSRFADGKIGWCKLAGRAQETRHRWEFDENGEVLGMWQLAPPHFVLKYIPLQKALLFRTTAYKGNPEGRSLIRSAYRCFSSDTDLLTDRGWVAAGDVATNDKVATLNPATNQIEYQHPERTWSYEYDGDLVHAHSRHIDQLVTPNHRMWVRKDRQGIADWVDADKCLPSYRLSSCGDWKAPDASTIQIGEQTIPVDVWAPFLGMWLAEGHSWSNGTRHEIGISQKEGPVADEIRKLVKDLPWSSYEAKRADGMIRWTFTRSELWDALAPLGKSVVKRIPRYVMSWSAAEIDSFLYAYTLGDGSQIGNLSQYGGTPVIFTASEGMADDLMELVLLAGHRPAKRLMRHDKSHMGGPIWVVTIGKDMDFKAQWDRVAYKGSVHCVTTDNGIVYTRRNGKCSWSGNSWFFKRRIEEIEAIGIERDLAGLPVAHVPYQMMTSSATPEEKATLTEIKKLVRNIRRDEQDGVVFPRVYDPETKMPLYELTLLGQGAGRRQFDTDKIIVRYEQRMAMVVLADFILFGQNSTGARSLGETKADMFTTALESLLAAIADVFNTYAIPRLLQMNGEDPAQAPKLTFGKLTRISLTELAAFITAMASAGADLFPDQQLEDHLREVSGLPPKAASDNL